MMNFGFFRKIERNTESDPPNAQVPGGENKYDLFISYSHQDNARFGRLFHSYLESFGVPFFRGRSIRVFLDDASAPMSSDLWGTIQQALDQSAFLVLLASPKSAKSEWVQREIDYFCGSNHISKMGIVLTLGNTPWTDEEFDANDANCGVSRQTNNILNQSGGEPLVVDFRPFRTESQKIQRNSESDSRIASVISAVTGRNKDELFGLHIRRLKQRMLVFAGLIVLSIFAAITAGILGVQASRAQQEAQFSAHLELTRRLASQSQQIRNDRPIVSTLLAIEAVKSMQALGKRVPEAERAIQTAFSDKLGQRLASHNSGIHFLTFTSDSKTLITAGDENEIQFFDLQSTNFFTKPLVLNGTGPINVSEDGRWLAASSSEANGDILLWKLRDLSDALSDPTVLQAREPENPNRTFSSDGNWIVSISKDGEPFLWRVGNEAIVKHQLSPAENATETIGAKFSSDGKLLAVWNANKGLDIWEISLNSPPKLKIRMSEFDGDIASLAFNPNNGWVAVGTKNHSLYLRPLLLVQHEKYLAPLTHKYDSSVSMVKFSKDGRWLAAASSGARHEDSSDKNNFIKLWKIRKTREIADTYKLSSHSAAILSMKFSSDSNWFVSGSASKTALLWNLRSNDPSKDPVNLGGHLSAVDQLEFSSDNNWLVTASDTERLVSVWNLKDISVRQVPDRLVVEHDQISSLSISKDSKWLAVASKNTTRVWNLPSREMITAPRKYYETNVSFSPNNRWLFVSGGETGFPLMWIRDTTNLDRKWVRLNVDDDDIRGGIFSIDGSWFVGRDPTKGLWLWNLASEYQFSKPQRFPGHEAEINALGFSPDGKWLVSGGQDGSIAVFDFRSSASPEFTRSLKSHPQSIEVIKFSADGERLLTASADGLVNIWPISEDGIGDQPIGFKGHSKGIRESRFLPNDMILTSGADQSVMLWSTESAGVIRQHKLDAFGDEEHFREDASANLMLSPSGRWLVTASLGVDAKLWDLEADDPATTAKKLEYDALLTTTAVFSADEKWLAVKGDGLEIYVWNLQDSDFGAATVILEGHTQIVSEILFHHDSKRLISSSSDGTIRIWDLSVPMEPNSMVLRGHREGVGSIILSPNGERLASYSADGSVRVWTINEEIPSHSVNHLARSETNLAVMGYSPDSRWLFVGNESEIAMISMNVGDLILDAQLLIGRNFSLAEWEEFFPGVPYRRTLEELPDGPSYEERFEIF